MATFKGNGEMHQLNRMKQTVRDMDERIRATQEENMELYKELGGYKTGTIDIKDLIAALAALRLDGANRVQKVVILNLLHAKGDTR